MHSLFTQVLTLLIVFFAASLGFKNKIYQITSTAFTNSYPTTNIIKLVDSYIEAWRFSVNFNLKRVKI